VLEGEEKLKFSMLYTIDGNDSLKRIQRCEAAPIPFDNDASTFRDPILGDSSESKDMCKAGKGVYLTNEQSTSGQRKSWLSFVLSTTKTRRMTICVQSSGAT